MKPLGYDKGVKLRFVKHWQEVGDIYSFLFVPQEPLNWHAGQSLRLEIPAAYDTDERRFTIASAPYEKNIMITTRLTESEFKKGLLRLIPGAEVDAFAVEGDFLYSPHRPAVFVAAGIGITPFRAIVRQAAEVNKLAHVRLLYGARKNELLYMAEWQVAAAHYPQFRYELFSGQRLTGTLVRQKAEAMDSPLYYLSGPTAMVDGLYHELLSLKVAESEIITDRFTGY